MKLNKTTPFQKVALISAPWPLYNRPSIQIATLKAHLIKKFPELKVDAHHLYLKVAEAVGYSHYHAISERTWLAETVYAALLYPENLEGIKKVFYKKARGKTLLRDIGFDSLTRQVQEVSEKFIQSTDWRGYGLVGFSICLCQLTASLYFIKKIKERFPTLFIVVGGSMFTGEAIRNIFKVFPEIDIIVNGEGEIPLSRLVSCLTDVEEKKRIPFVKGIVMPEAAEKETRISFNQMKDLSNLVPPDYSDYFELLASLGPEKNFFPTLPMEISRGCWWQSKNKGRKSKGCAFCNLNLQWDGYRTKKPEQVVLEIDDLTTTYKTLSVAFTDNLLPLKTSRSIFKQIKTLKKDVHLFGEIRATTPLRDLREMHAAGMQEVQIGIEALSTRLLNKLNKGTTAIQNIEIMKHCEMLGIQNSSNLIVQFPGSDEEDVAETLQNLEFTLSFRPLRMVHFWLGLGSPVWQDPETFGIKAVFNHKNYAGIFPPNVVESMQFAIQTYRGDLGYQKRLWQPVKKKLKAWEKAYAKLHQRPKHENILSFRDGRSFLIIRQRRLDGEALTHRLEGTSRAIYLYCQKHRALKRIIDRFSAIPSDRIEPFLKMMVDKKLMFRENHRYLSLAVPERPNTRKS
ncbi:MAG: RiPP maturation radical SAM C-methyltransferase [Desulfobacteraceae bacterium]|nr:RiPP maturation radical SAM C-methyltransferase [Desulfobacteraceae bacterium]MDH3881320.1 RiPP maturation radical SAM C-methyltransferase [Desulfobacteraceae bacterium]